MGPAAPPAPGIEPSGSFPKASAHGSTGALNAYLHTVDEQASERFDVLMKGYAQSWGITEALKAEDPIKWVGLMNLARAEAEHNVMTEIICA